MMTAAYKARPAAPQPVWRPRPQATRQSLTFLALSNQVNSCWQREESLPLEQRTRGAVLREEISKLGPVFVKCGQTLAERPDLIGDEAAGALKLLQGENTPFPNELAWEMMAQDLAWPGPLAPNVPFRNEPLSDPANAKLLAGEPLFKWMSPDPIAAASLAQARAGSPEPDARRSMSPRGASELAALLQRAFSGSRRPEASPRVCHSPPHPRPTPCPPTGRLARCTRWRRGTAGSSP